MSSLPTWVGKGLKEFLEILLLTYEVKPYKPKVKQIVEIGQDLKL
jgi:hypothetical protein